MGQDLALDITESTRIHIREENAVVKLDSGSLNITADGDINIRGDGSGDILFAQNGGGLRVAPNGDITMFGHDISFKADEIVFNGQVDRETVAPPAAPAAKFPETLSPLQISNLTEKGELEPLPNFVDLEYLYEDDTGVAGAGYTLTDLDGNLLAEGTLDQNGRANVPLPLDITQVQVYYHDDPEDVDVVRPTEPEPRKAPKNWLARMTGHLTDAWDTAKDAAEWSWGMLKGDFNEDATVGQIATNAVITAIPLVDQVGDARDLTAGLKMLVWDKRYKEKAVWFGFLITLLGLVPIAGSLLKGVGKVINKGAKLDTLLGLFNYFMKGNGVKWLRALKEGKLAKYVDDAAKQGHKIIDKITDIIGDLKGKLPRRFQNLHKKAQGIIDTLNEVKSRINRQFDDIAKELCEKLGKSLDEGAENSVSGSSRRTLKKTQTVETPDNDSVFHEL